MGKDGVAKHVMSETLIWKKRQKLGKEVWEPYTREYAPNDPTRPYPTIWADLPTMRQAKAMLRDIFNTSDLFSTPKPIELLERILTLSSGPNDLVLDFFAGSGTTAHAVHKLNAADGGKRRCILVSSTEATADAPDKNICRDVCGTRVRRVIEGYTTADGEKIAGLGGDFAYLRTRRIPADSLLEMRHEEIWTALQLANCDTLSEFDAAAPYLWAGTEDAAICYVPRFTLQLLPALRQQVKKSAAVILYSWQPLVLQQHLRAGCVDHKHVSETLTGWFNFKLGAQQI